MTEQELGKEQVLVIIPAYNEEANIRETVRQVAACGYSYVVINDCSTDRTREICEENGIHMLNLPINLGIGGAMQTGYRYARKHNFAYAVQVDGDGQHDPEWIGRMLAEMKEKNADMVIGSRFITKEGFQSSALRQTGIRYFTALIKSVTGTTITDPTSGLRMVNRSVIEEFADDYPRDYPEPESTTRILNEGRSVVEIPVIMRARQGGVSSIRATKAVYYMVKVSLAVLFAGSGSKRRK